MSASRLIEFLSENGPVDADILYYLFRDIERKGQLGFQLFNWWIEPASIRRLTTAQFKNTPPPAPLKPPSPQKRPSLLDTTPILNDTIIENDEEYSLYEGLDVSRTWESTPRHSIQEAEVSGSGEGGAVSTTKTSSKSKFFPGGTETKTSQAPRSRSISDTFSELKNSKTIARPTTSFCTTSVIAPPSSSAATTAHWMKALTPQPDTPKDPQPILLKKLIDVTNDWITSPATVSCPRPKSTNNWNSAPVPPNRGVITVNPTIPLGSNAGVVSCSRESDVLDRQPVIHLATPFPHQVVTLKGPQIFSVQRRSSLGDPKLNSFFITPLR